MRRHPISGQMRFHSGIDISSGSGTPVRTLAGGTVIAAAPTRQTGGFGNTVAVRTSDGHIEMYAHLSWMDVSVGDVIPPGRFIGREGSTGASTGPHVHLTIFKPGTQVSQLFAGNYRDITINPRDYMGRVQQASQAPGGTGGAQGVASNVQQLRGVGNGYVADPASLYTTGSPYRNGRASVNRSDYAQATPLTANHGYPQLDQTRDRYGGYRARVLNAAANRLGIPGQWLADVIHFESAGTWAASVPHDNGRGVGLIGFHESGGLGDVAQAMGVTLNEAKNRLRRMTFQQQIEWVVYYIDRYTTRAGRRIQTIEDLYALVHQGPAGLSRSPGTRSSGSYRDVMNGRTFNQLIQRLGNDVGRRYQTSYDDLQSSLVPHDHLVEGCPTCAQMLQFTGEVQPHYA